MTLDIQIASDLHLEYNKITDYTKLIEPTSPILILAGDIGNLYEYDKLKHFMEWCCDNFAIVIYVPGNHEYYKVYQQTVAYKYELDFRLRQLEKELSNLYLLSRNCIEINGIYFVGCTLWTEFKQKYLPHYIVRINGFNKYLYNKEHFKDLKFIEKVLQYDKKVVVITHHPPIIVNRNKKSRKYDSLYNNNLGNFIEKHDNILAWISGHIHYNFDMNLHGTRFVSNQLGKPHDNIQNFKKNFTISL